MMCVLHHNGTPNNPSNVYPTSHSLPAGLEPAIFGLEVQRVIHFATRASPNPVLPHHPHYILSSISQFPLHHLPPPHPKSLTTKTDGLPIFKTTIPLSSKRSITSHVSQPTPRNVTIFPATFQSIFGLHHSPSPDPSFSHTLSVQFLLNLLCLSFPSFMVRTSSIPTQPTFHDYLLTSVSYHIDYDFGRQEHRYVSKPSTPISIHGQYGPEIGTSR